MEESWRGFRMLFTLEAKVTSMDYGSLQKEFLGALTCEVQCTSAFVRQVNSGVSIRAGSRRNSPATPHVFAAYFDFQLLEF